MSHHHIPADIDPATLETSRKIWDGFTHMIKFGVIGVVILLLAMAFFLA